MSKNHRLNLAIDLDLLERLRETAKTRYNAPLHHISGQPELTSTIVKLLELGLKALTDEDEIIFEDENPQSLREKYEGLERKFEGLAYTWERLNDRVIKLESNTDITQIPIHIEDEDDLTQIPIHIEDTKVEDEDNLPSNLTQSTQIVAHIEDTKDEDETIQIVAHIVSTKVEDNLQQSTDNLEGETITRKEMSELMKVSKTTISRWVKALSWDKFPQEWKWNSEKELFERLTA